MPVKMDHPQRIISRLGISYGGRVHKFFTEECARRMERFVPYREGTLSETVIVNGEPTYNVRPGRITYAQPYAKYVYEGMSKSGKPLHYTKTFHPGAGPYWDERMKSVDMKSIEKAVQRYINGGYNE